MDNLTKPRSLMDLKIPEPGPINGLTLLNCTSNIDAVSPPTSPGRPLPVSGDQSPGTPSASQVPKRSGQSRKGAPRHSRSHSFTPYAAPPPGMSADTCLLYTSDAAD